ncbi:PilZ domain-containing protein [Desulfobacterota bacterium M19]
MKIPDKKTSSCPYLSNNSDCLMITGGLYLPLPEQIKMFCQSASFHQCHQYISGCEKISNTAPLIESEKINRRRYRRIPEHLNLTLCDCSTNHESKLRDIPASTVDIGMGGLMFKSTQRIAPDTELIFVMDNNELFNSGLDGRGIVRWSTPDTKDPDFFLAGLSFSDNSSKQAVGRSLWSKHNHIS